VVGAYSSIGDRGADLIERRVEYGLLHSKEDMRLQLMSDTKPILHEHLIFGVGLGGWANEYARHMSPLLSGIDPVYLHNEPAQLLVELGIVGLAPLLAGIVTVAWFVASSLTTSRDRLIRLALLTGILATLLATLFDFHLRIPAIVLQLAVLTGLISFLTDSEEPRTPAHLGK
jgi:O-antigen ligase